MKRWLTLALALYLLLAARSSLAFADSEIPKCPNGCPRFHVELWSGGTYDTDDDSLWYRDNIYGYNIGFNYTSGRVEPKCLDPGYITWHCSVCNYTQIEEIPPLGHDFVLIETKEPTCIKDGYKKMQCSRHTVRYWGDGSMSIKGCAVEDTEVIPKLGHDFSDVIDREEPTCVSDGYEIRACSRCEFWQREVLPAEGHKWDKGNLLQEGTCVTPALYERKCTVCGTVEGTIEGEIEHTWDRGDELREGNCKTPALYEKKCTVCGIVVGTIEGETDPGNHPGYEFPVIKGTCIKDSKLIKRCTLCRKEWVLAKWKEPHTPAQRWVLLEHSIVTVREIYCTVCKKVLYTHEGPILLPESSTSGKVMRIPS